MSMSLPPGFRFNPTDEELIFYYLRNRAASAQCPAPIIADVDVYKFDPWDLPCQASYGDSEWYFFSPRDRKYPNGTRPNRAAGSGYWKSAGTDKPIHDGAIGKGVGVKKALVFYQGRAPRGNKTGWVMHEYRIAADPLAAAFDAYKPIIKCGSVSMRLDDWVLCRIYKKTGQQAPPMVPVLTLADYDLSDGGSRAFDDGPGLFTPFSTSSMITQDQQPQTGSPEAAGWLPTIPFISKLFDHYPITHIFDTDTEHLAVHPSLNQLLSGGDGTHVEPSYYAPSRSSPDVSGSGRKRKAASPEEDVGDGGGISVGWPPVVVQETQRVVLGGASAVVAAVVAQRIASSGESVLRGLNHQVCMRGDMNETIFYQAENERNDLSHSSIKNSRYSPENTAQE